MISIIVVTLCARISSVWTVVVKLVAAFAALPRCGAGWWVRGRVVVGGRGGGGGSGGGGVVVRGGECLVICGVVVRGGGVLEL